MAHREEVLARQEERIERERRAPPDGELSEAARALLRRIASGRIDVEEADRSAFREPAADWLVTLGSSFAGRPESAYRFTYWGWKLKNEILACDEKIA